MRTGQHFERMLFGRGEGKPAFHAFAASENIGHDLDQRGIAHQFQKLHAGIDGHARAHRSREGIIAKGHAQIFVHGEHAFHHAGQDGFAARAFELQTFEQPADAGDGAAEGLGQRSQVIVAGGQLLLGNLWIQQAFGVGAQTGGLA